MSDQVSITKIVLNVQGKEINLSVDEAKSLRTILNEIFGNTPTHIHYDSPPYPLYWQKDYSIGINDPSKVLTLTATGSSAQG